MPDPWRRLKPDDVSARINFDAGNPEWQYKVGFPASMASLQTEGVAHLWNLLGKHRVALLADEVGMGKTFQALAVAAMLWRKKPNAKILVMAPNREICAHWKLEFGAFTRSHYRKSDGRVRDYEEGEPVPQIDLQFRLHDLATAVETSASAQSQVGRLYLTTIHSLSGLVDSTDGSCDKLGSARRVAANLHGRIMRALDHKGFDLIIIDEAHYFRNPNGGSQRAAAAKSFFVNGNSRIAQRALLLTATPVHTHLDDVANILGYFIATEDSSGCIPSTEALMHKYGLRRFRRMPGKDGITYTKHQYRKEIATPCKFGDSVQDEMFFALYQRKLVRNHGLVSEKRRLLYGYLEGFESVGDEQDTIAVAKDAVDEQQEDRGRDFHTTTDTQLLQELSSDFSTIHHTPPDHPKYGRVVDQCTPVALFGSNTNCQLYEDKHLVFVRRIPSVRELTKRVNKRYDEILADHIRNAKGWDILDPRYARWRAKNWSREVFNEIASSADQFVPEDDDNNDVGNESDEQEAQDQYLRSRIAELFVTKQAKNGKKAEAATECSRFSLSLRKSTSIFAMFMEPASDYTDGGYDWYYEYSQGGHVRLDYTKAAQISRLEMRNCGLKSDIEGLRPRDAKPRRYKRQIKTLWSLVFKHLDPANQNKLRAWAEKSPEISENFANYLKAGFVFASPVVVELYAWYVRVQHDLPQGEQHAQVQMRYRRFVDFVEKHIPGSLLLRYFIAALDTFEQLCDKIIDHKPNDWKKGWRSLTTLSSPAWYASGQSSSRQHLIFGFNSPFYPNTLVATSVFQEGVNLHLQCRKVHHYGIAWTPGDNEQRVGRVDRLFGKVNRLLSDFGPENVTLEINYPYLKHSFDEDQVGSFIERKYDVEEKMDRCAQGSFDKEVRMTRARWEDFLRQPISKPDLQDPYPARF